MYGAQSFHYTMTRGFKGTLVNCWSIATTLDAVFGEHWIGNDEEGGIEEDIRKLRTGQPVTGPGSETLTSRMRSRVLVSKSNTASNVLLCFVDRASWYDPCKQPTWRTIFHVCLFLFSTCFGQPCAHHQENYCINATPGLCHSV